MLTSVLNSRVASNTDDVLCGEALQVGRELAYFDVKIFCSSVESRPQAAAPSVMLETCLWHDPPPGMSILQPQRFARIEDVLGCHEVLPWIGWIDTPRPVDGAAWR